MKGGEIETAIAIAIADGGCAWDLGLSGGVHIGYEHTPHSHRKPEQGNSSSEE